MTPEIKKIEEKKLIGKRQTMSLSDNKTANLWRSFMPLRSEIKNNLTNDLISLQVYKQSYFAEFNPTGEFEKWAAVEVSDFNNVPAELETFTLTDGLYAVFNYKGLSTDNSIFQFIFGTWLPGSEYDLDNRPHFEVLGDKYINNDPTSEEEIWIPVRLKGRITIK